MRHMVKVGKRSGGEKLRALRESLGWSQTELAEQLDTSQVTVSQLETGDRPVPHLEIAVKIREISRKHGREIRVEDWL